MILLITNTQDATADYVVRELSQRGTGFYRLNTDEFPVHGRGLLHVGHQSDAAILWDNREFDLDFSKVRSAWYRRPVPPVVNLDTDDPAISKFAVDEAYEFLRGVWYSQDWFWVSHPDSIRRAEHKIVQLRLARKMGFDVPATLVSNDVDEVKRFSTKCPHGVIAKPLYLGFFRTLDGPRFVYTTRLSRQHLEMEGAIRATPTIYQEYVKKVADIRVTVIGDRVFSARIDADDLPEHIPDWRLNAGEGLHHSTFDLPAGLASLCRELVQALGLQFGAIDFGLTPDGRLRFFEINPNGQWAWIEKELLFPMSAALVDLLEKAA